MDRRRAALAPFALAALATGGTRHAFAQGNVPLTLLPTGDIGGLLALRVELGAESALAALAVLDTGATSHLVDPALARAAGLAADGQAAVALPGGRGRARRVRLPELRLAALAGESWRDQHALEVDLAALRAASGADLRMLLGAPLFAGRRVTIDLAAQTLAFDRPPDGTALIDVPLHDEGGLPAVDLRLSPTLEGRFLLDTGNAGAVLLFARRAEALLRETPLPELRVHELGGTVAARFARSARAELGRLARADVPVALEVGSGARRGGHFDRLAGSLGVAFFDGAAITLDARAGRLSVRPPSGDLAVPGGFGFSAATRPEGLTVAAVLAGGPAERAGVKPGDRIARVGGLDGLNAPAHPGRLWQTLRGVETASLVLERDGRVLEVFELRRAAFFPLLP